MVIQMLLALKNQPGQLFSSVPLSLYPPATALPIPPWVYIPPTQAQCCFSQSFLFPGSWADLAFLKPAPTLLQVFLATPSAHSAHKFQCIPWLPWVWNHKLRDRRGCTSEQAGPVSTVTRPPGRCFLPLPEAMPAALSVCPLQNEQGNDRMPLRPNSPPPSLQAEVSTFATAG